jgi:hypothetical protein
LRSFHRFHAVYIIIDAFLILSFPEAPHIASFHQICNEMHLSGIQTRPCVHCATSNHIS